MPDVLIADDHSVARLGLAWLTRKAIGESCNIDFARTGQEVLQRLLEKKYQLLLCDLLMPDQLGVALIGQALELQDDLNIVIISVKPEQHFASACLQAGALAYISKSVPDDVFIKTIRSVYKDHVL